MNILQKPYGITYKEVALIFPLLKYANFNLKLPTSKAKEVDLNTYNQQKLEEFFDKIEKGIQEDREKERIKQEKKERIENKINEIIKKIEDF